MAAGRGVHFTTYVPRELADEARDAVDYLSGPPERLNLSKLVTDALASHLRRLKKKYRIERFPRRPGPLMRGRNQR